MENNKNLILAILLCMAVMFGWTLIAEHFGLIERPDPNQQVEQSSTSQATQSPQNQSTSANQEPLKLSTFKPAPGKDIIVDTPLYKATIYSGGAILHSFELKNYHYTSKADSPRINLVNATTAATAPLGLLVNGQPSWSTGKWSFEGKNLDLKTGQESLIFTAEVDNLRIERQLTFYADTYQITEKVRVTSLGDTTRSVRLGYTVGEDSSTSSGGNYDMMAMAWNLDGSRDDNTDAEELATQGIKVEGNILWAASMSTYFMSAIAPKTTHDLTLKGRLQNDVYRVALEQGDIMAGTDIPAEQQITYWIGPKVRSLLDKAPNDLVSSIDLGMFSMIAKGLLWLLQFFYNYVHNWGVAIILLTVVIKIAFWPLTAKSYSSMEKMKKLQPQMQIIREKYADDKEAMNREVMNLYKTYKVNPASGCLPILIQLPVFFGLYQALLTSIELRHASFINYLPFTDIVWLADLSAKDPLYITPVIMGITMFLQQKMSPPMGGDPIQQKVMMFLPVIFTVMFLSFPSGLVLYWLVNNVLSITQQGLMISKSKKLAK